MKIKPSFLEVLYFPFRNRKATIGSLNHVLYFFLYSTVINSCTLVAASSCTRTASLLSMIDASTCCGILGDQGKANLSCLTRPRKMPMNAQMCVVLELKLLLLLAC